MKAYQVVLDDCREEVVVADEWMRVDGKVHFYANGEPIADVFFREDCVKGINVITDNPEDLNRSQAGGIPRQT